MCMEQIDELQRGQLVELCVDKTGELVHGMKESGTATCGLLVKVENLCLEDLCVGSGAVVWIVQGSGEQWWEMWWTCV
jgi:hypothetical protein